MSTFNIDTNRLKIRNLNREDLGDFHRYRSNPEVTKYQGFDVFNLEQAKAFMEDNAKKQFGTPGEWMQFGIENKATGCLIGDCAIKLDKNDSRMAEIGITVSPFEQQKGFAKETMIGILDFLFSR